MYAEGERLPNQPPAIVFHCLQCGHQDVPLSYRETLTLGASRTDLQRFSAGWSSFIWDDGVPAEDALDEEGAA